MKGRKLNDSETVVDIRQLIRSLTNNLRGLETANADPSLRLAYQKLIESLSDSDHLLAKQIFGNGIARTKHVSNKTDNTESDEEISKISLEELDRLMMLEDVSRVRLAQIATARFSVPKGTVSKLSRAVLCAKLKTLIENEKTHQTIAKAARNTNQ